MCRKVRGSGLPSAQHQHAIIMSALPPSGLVHDWRALYRDLCMVGLAMQAGVVLNAISSGTGQSSCDHAEQTVWQTINQDSRFWSSTGSADAHSSEYLIYQLSMPITLISEVELSIYRCEYQSNFPCYAPVLAQVSVGFLPDVWHYRSPPFLIEQSAAVQRLLLGPELVYGQYVRIDLFGRRQRQQQDGLYYTTVRHVGVAGIPAAALRTPLLHSLLNAIRKALKPSQDRVENVIEPDHESIPAAIECARGLDCATDRDRVAQRMPPSVAAAGAGRVAVLQPSWRRVQAAMRSPKPDTNQMGAHFARCANTLNKIRARLRRVSTSANTNECFALTVATPLDCYDNDYPFQRDDASIRSLEKAVFEYARKRFSEAESHELWNVETPTCLALQAAGCEVAKHSMDFPVDAMLMRQLAFPIVLDACGRRPNRALFAYMLALIALDDQVAEYAAQDGFDHVPWLPCESVQLCLLTVAAHFPSRITLLNERVFGVSTEGQSFASFAHRSWSPGFDRDLPPPPLLETFSSSHRSILATACNFDDFNSASLSEQMADIILATRVATMMRTARGILEKLNVRSKVRTAFNIFVLGFTSNCLQSCKPLLVVLS
jgi:hypothetical protein